MGFPENVISPSPASKETQTNINWNGLPRINFPLVLIKLGQLEHLLELQQQGHLFCNAINYFGTIPDDSVRYDPDENVVNISQLSTNSYLEVFPPDSPSFRFVAGIMKERVTEPWGNLYCLYSVRFSRQPKGTPFDIHKSNKEFGSHFLVIWDTERFYRQLDEAIERQKLIHQRGFVEYIDFGKHEGVRNILQKDKKYRFQQEYRIRFMNDTAYPLSVYIGSIADISTIYPREFIDDFKLKIDKRPRPVEHNNTPPIPK